MEKFRLNNYNKPGKGVKKDSVKENFSFLNFFKIYFRKFWKFCSVNLMYILFNFPILIFLLGISGNFDVPFKTPAGPMFQQLNSVILHTGINPAMQVLLGFERNGRLVESGYADTVSQTLIWLGLLVILTFGIANSGMAYIFRNYAREEHAYVFSDYISTIKRNFFPAMALGILDILFGAVIAYDIIFFNCNTGINFMTDIMFWIALLLAIVYIIMRFYMYMILVTFKLSIFKVIKNSFIFTFLCLKRNIAGLLGIITVLVLNYLILAIFPPLGAIIPFLFTISLLGFIGAYTAYPGIKYHMIDPYYANEPKEETTIDSERIFNDN